MLFRTSVWSGGCQPHSVLQELWICSPSTRPAPATPLRQWPCVERRVLSAIQPLRVGGLNGSRTTGVQIEYFQTCTQCGAKRSTTVGATP